MCFNQTGDIFTLGGGSLKLVNKFTYLGSSVSSTEKDIDTRLTKAWTAFDRLSVMWKSDQTDKMKRSFFQAAAVSILLYGCTKWMLTKRMEKSLTATTQECCEEILTSPNNFSGGQSFFLFHTYLNFSSNCRSQFYFVLRPSKFLFEILRLISYFDSLVPLAIYVLRMSSITGLIAYILR